MLTDPPRMKIIDAGQNAPAVVFVNSLATDFTMWDDVTELLAADHTVVLFNQRDREGAGAHAPFALDDLVDDLLAVMDAADVRMAHLVGVSLGGIVALRTASREPDRVLSLTAMCCAARFPEETWVERGRAVRRDGIAPLIPAIIDRWFTRRFQAENPETTAHYRSMLEATDEAGYAHACDALAQADTREELARILTPTLVISGAEDSANPVEHQRLIADSVPGAEHVILPGVAHLAPAEAPDETARLIRRHIRASARRGAS